MRSVIKRERFSGADAAVMENDALRCVCLPEHGGKLASLYYKKNGFELLFQNPFEKFRKAQPGSNFGDFEACGFDDAFPNIDEGVVHTDNGERTYFDHGEIWTAKFDCRETPDGFELLYKSPYLGFVYSKVFSLAGNSLNVNYRITNESNAAFPYLWACHCLVNYRPDMRLVFPRGTDSVMTVMDTDILGPAGTVYRFPADRVYSGTSYDFTAVPAADGKTMLKYYCCKASEEGRCGYIYPADGIKAVFRYDPTILPYLGFWITAGGYRGDVNCALEPTNGFYDSIAKAQSNGRCSVLAPQQEISFTLSITLDDLGSKD